MTDKLKTVYPLKLRFAGGINTYICVTEAHVSLNKMTKFAIILNQRVLDYICTSLAHAKCLVKIIFGRYIFTCEPIFNLFEALCRHLKMQKDDRSYF